MAKLIKYEYINDIHVYKCDLTDEMHQLWKEDEDAFWVKYGMIVEEKMEFSHDKVGDPNDEYQLEED